MCCVARNPPRALWRDVPPEDRLGRLIIGTIVPGRAAHNELGRIQHGGTAVNNVSIVQTTIIIITAMPHVHRSPNSKEVLERPSTGLCEHTALVWEGK